MAKFWQFQREPNEWQESSSHCTYVPFHSFILCFGIGSHMFLAYKRSGYWPPNHQSWVLRKRCNKARPSCYPIIILSWGTLLVCLILRHELHCHGSHLPLYLGTLYYGICCHQVPTQRWLVPFLHIFIPLLTNFHFSAIGTEFGENRLFCTHCTEHGDCSSTQYCVDFYNMFNPGCCREKQATGQFCNPQREGIDCTSGTCNNVVIPPFFKPSIYDPHFFHITHQHLNQWIGKYAGNCA